MHATTMIRMWRKVEENGARFMFQHIGAYIRNEQDLGVYILLVMYWIVKGRT